jgi:multicomponent Na+:H+ antiporter subunit D
VALLLQLLLLTVFAIKAAVFPLSFWLPDSYPTAPAPVTAVFAGLLTKVGVYAIIRTQTLLFPDSPLSGLLLWAALLTMLIGILGAVAQSDIKRMLSFTLVSHIGYMVFGVGLATVGGYTGAIFYVVHHITIQTALFLVLGLVEYRAGSTSVIRLGGLARLAPLVGVLFFVPAMNLAGIPPMSGFLGKVALIEAGLRVGSPLADALVAATPAEAHETARELSHHQSNGTPIRPRDHVQVRGNVLPTRDLEEARRVVSEDETDVDLHQLMEMDALPRRLPATMVGATAGLIGVSLALSVLAGPLFGYAHRAASDLLDHRQYVTAVLQGGSR